MTNLLRETLAILAEHEKTLDDVDWIGSKDGHIEKNVFTTLADVEYDSGYGASEVAVDLMIIGDNFYMTRGEYDGSEWWEYHSMELFKKPKNKLRVHTLIGGLWNNLVELEGSQYDDEG